MQEQLHTLPRGFFEVKAGELACSSSLQTFPHLSSKISFFFSLTKAPFPTKGHIASAAEHCDGITLISALWFSLHRIQSEGHKPPLWAIQLLCFSPPSAFTPQTHLICGDDPGKLIRVSGIYQFARQGQASSCSSKRANTKLLIKIL